jgi:hypothetical protein
MKTRLTAGIRCDEFLCMPNRSCEKRLQQMRPEAYTLPKSDLHLLNKVSSVDNLAILVQFEGSIMHPLILVALMLRLPISPVSIQTGVIDLGSRGVLHGNSGCLRLKRVSAKSVLTLEEGNPCGRVQAVVLSTYSTAIVFEPFWMFLISWLDTYFVAIIATNQTS